MTGVPQSSSQAGSSAVQPAAEQRSFDVGSEAELLKLLNFIRRGPFLPDQKNMLRDVVLDFATTKDPEVLSVVETALERNNASLTNGGKTLSGEPIAVMPAPAVSEETAQHSSEVVTGSPTVAAEPEPVAAEILAEPTLAPTAPAQSALGFGGGRPQPTFGNTTSAPTVAPTPIPEPPVQEEESPKTVPVKSADPEPAPSVTEKTPEVSTAMPAPNEPKTPAPVPEPLVEETPTIAETPAPVEQAVPAPRTPATDPLTRIKEIKMLVNQKVGNPVNLIDSNNEVGREYMNALLNAMKSINGGSHEDATLGMQRLEKAYAAVERSLSSGEIVIGKKEEKQAPAPVESNAAKETPATPGPTAARWGTSSIPPDAEFQAAPQAIPDMTPASETVPQAPAAPEPVTTAVPKQMVVIENDAPVVPPTPQAPVTPAQAPQVPPVPTAQPSPAAPSPEPVPAAPQTPSTPPPARSVAEQVQAEQAQRAEATEKNAAAIQAEQAALMNDPLHAESVTHGIEQLLSEWKLFKSSGIFGTGPSGYDHPLFKAIAPLPMAAVIAGRFDGATPEIRQSLSDYMSGWRYEQGVVHEMNESFEHYLRRVVHKILERQASGSPQLPN